ncbi:hypothetical protein A2625_03250 [candidate division WOR-1 bacterium RIFCSPHIGHO2_01_FULL_53_15]|uniref:histidine kinase n=1 Tax=candidate division WOR-1 bacterium RIFCSPHIGHO2_01_FULL_53_15 TaxID=1802564 RepID=A0A1F4Q3L1_UNCSA|nr:MAG: hypothetical protein A2625_03250 [candidate division WOR-1 bacterium RIFCSPHIGHO2_01_FULL_53_15]OGC12478.1 MAG: hypothetical protein A3D23_05670 [candidate division WOR-1 bacterium RIFCSPHIGHO2_02_FULL_53_26]
MTLNIISLLFTALASFALGIFVFSRGRQRLSNIFLALLAASIGVWCFGQFMGEIVPGKEAVIFWSRVNVGAAVLIPLFYLSFIISFIDRLAEDRPILAAAYFTNAILLLMVLTPYFVADVAPRLGYRYYPTPGPVYAVFAVFLLVQFVFAFVRLFGFLRRSQGGLRNQARYIFFSSVVGLAGGATAFFPVFNLNLPVISYIVLPFYLAILAYAIVKHHLLDIELVFREGLIYSTLTIFFAVFYALAILISNRIFTNLTSFNELSATLIVVFASVIVFQPLRDRVQSAVDRLFFKGDYFYKKTINDLSAENLKLYRGLLQADKLSALGTIAAGLAHEIKNPLASIKGLTQVLPENLDDPDFIKKYSEIVPRQLDRVNRIVEDLLDFGHPAGLIMAEVDLARELEGVLRLVENQGRKSDIEIVRNFAPLPPVQGSAEKLTQAFMNIILNAMQAMPDGGAVNVKCQMTNDKCLIEIADSGEGIPAERLPNIFDPFYTTKESGTGMGLAVTHRIIREHNGAIEVESEVGKGTTFKICLPIRPEPSA